MIRINKSAMIFALLASIVALLVIARESPKVSAQGPTPTVAVTPTSNPSPILMPTATRNPLEQMPGLYGEIIETSKRTIEAVKWSMSVVLMLIVLIVGIVGGFTVYRGKVAEDKASEAYAKASYAEQLLERTEENAARAQDSVNVIGQKITKLESNVHLAEDSIKSAVQVASTARDGVDKVQTEIDAASKRLTDLNRQADELRRILGVFEESDLHFLATLRLIDRYRRTLVISSDPKRRQQAEWALLEKTHADSPLLLRESVIALSGIGEPSEAVIERLEEIVAEDGDLEVKQLAKAALENWPSRSSFPT